MHKFVRISLVLTASLLLSLNVFAQDDEPDFNFRDTLVVKLQGKSQLWIIGNSFKEVKAYARFDSILALFFLDFSSITANKSPQDWPKEVHHLIASDGKRRMKVQSPEYKEKVDLQLELRRMKEDLPARQYIIYDVGTGIQLNLFSDAQSDLAEFKTINKTRLNEIANFSKKDARRYYRIDYNLADNKKVAFFNKRTSRLEIHPDINLWLIGNQLVPSIGFETRLMIEDRFGKPTWSIAYAMPYYCFANFKEGTFSSTSFHTGLEIRTMLNTNRASKNGQWIGLELGWYMNNNSQDPKPLGEQPFRFGVYSSMRNIGVGFGSFVDLKNDNFSLYTLNLRLPF